MDETWNEIWESNAYRIFLRSHAWSSKQYTLRMGGSVVFYSDWFTVQFAQIDTGLSSVRLDENQKGKCFITSYQKRLPRRLHMQASYRYDDWSETQVYYSYAMWRWSMGYFGLIRRVIFSLGTADPNRSVSVSEPNWIEISIPDTFNITESRSSNEIDYRWN